MLHDDGKIKIFRPGDGHGWSDLKINLTNNTIEINNFKKVYTFKYHLYMDIDNYFRISVDKRLLK